MSDPQQLEQELRDYLEKEPNLRRGDRLGYLRAIFYKHFEINKMEHLVNSQDLFGIISNAKGSYNKLRLPLRISRIQIDSSELIHIGMIESFISYLNKMNLLKKLVKFDYTD